MVNLTAREPELGDSEATQAQINIGNELKSSLKLHVRKAKPHKAFEEVLIENVCFLLFGFELNIVEESNSHKNGRKSSLA